MGKKEIWWKSSDSDDLSKAIEGQIRGLASSSWRKRLLRNHAQHQYTYTREKYAGFGFSGGEGDGSPEEFEGYYSSAEMDYRPSINITKSIIDTLTARLFREIPAVEVNPHNGFFELGIQAEYQTESLNGTMNTPQAQDELSQAGFDGVFSVLGATFPQVVDGTVRYPRVDVRQLFWNPREARRGNIRNLHYSVEMSKEQVIAQVKSWTYSNDKKDKQKLQILERLENLKPSPEKYFWNNLDEGHTLSPYDREIEFDGLDDSQIELLHLVYSWHLPGALGAEGGRYVITAHGAGEAVTIWDSPWERTTFPICYWCAYHNPSGGIEGVSISGTLRSIQYVIDRCATRLDDTLDTLGNTKVILFGGEDADQMADIVAPDMTVVTTNFKPGPDGPPYQILPGNPQSVQEVNWLQNMRATAFELVGVNQMAAQGMTARGANASALSMYEEDDRQMDRFAPVERRWDRFLLDVARETLNALNDEAERNPEFKVHFFRDGVVDSEKWEALRLPTSDYHLQIETTGTAARRKHGRIARIFELVDRGAIEPQQGMKQASTQADIAKLLNISNAGLNEVLWQLDGLSLHRSNPEDYDIYWPTPYTKLDVAETLAIATIQLANRKRAKPETIFRLETYLMMVQKLKAPPAPPMAPPGPGMPPGIQPEMGGEMPAELPPEMGGGLPII